MESYKAMNIPLVDIEQFQLPSHYPFLLLYAVDKLIKEYAN